MPDGGSGANGSTAGIIGGSITATGSLSLSNGGTVAGEPACNSSVALALRHVVLRQGTRFRVVPADDETLVAGFHAYEADGGMRWTDGEADLPAALFAGFNGPVDVVLHLDGSTRYLASEDRRRVA